MSAGFCSCRIQQAYVIHKIICKCRKIITPNACAGEGWPGWGSSARYLQFGQNLPKVSDFSGKIA